MSKITVSQIETPGNDKLQINSGIEFNVPIKIKNYTTAEINALTGMEIGELVFDTNRGLLKAFDGTSWEEVGGAPEEFDSISEVTLGAGVTVDGVLHKDGEISTDIINETNPGSGVTIDGVLLKDNAVNTDVISEKTTNQGVTVDGVVLKDAGITVAAHILPDGDELYDLGNTDNKFRDLYLSGTSLTLGDQTITTDATSIALPTIKTDRVEEQTAAGGITIPSDVTLTGTVDASGGTTVGFPKGKFEQVVYTFSDTEATYAMPYNNDGVEVALLTTTITPTSASSEIMIMLHIFGEPGSHDSVGFISREVSGNAEVYLKPTTIAGTRGAFHVGYYPDSDHNSTPHSTSYHIIDAPATNANVTYRVRLAKTSGSTTNFRFNGTINTTTSLNYEKGNSQLTLMEILA
jgi:hypothetical protein